MVNQRRWHPDVGIGLLITVVGASLMTSCLAWKEGEYLKDAPYHGNLCNALYQKRDLDGAVGECRAAIELAPKTPDYHFILGTALRDKGDLDGATAELRRAIGLNSQNAQYHFELSNTLSQKGDLDGAIGELRAAMSLDPKDSSIFHYDLGNLLIRKGDLDGSITEYRAAITSDPTMALAHLNLGNALFIGKGEIDAGIAEYHTSIQLDPKNAMFHNNLAAALEAKGEAEGAIEEFRTAIRLDPGNAEYQQHLDAITQKGSSIGDQPIDWEKVRKEERENNSSGELWGKSGLQKPKVSPQFRVSYPQGTPPPRSDASPPFRTRIDNGPIALGLSVSAPVRLKQEVHHGIALGRATDFHLFKGSHGHTAYSAGYFDAPDGYFAQYGDSFLHDQPNEALAVACLMLLRVPSPELYRIRSTNISVETSLTNSPASPGREWRAEADRTTVAVRVYLVNNRAYMLAVSAPKGEWSDVDATAFLDSFGLSWGG